MMWRWCGEGTAVARVATGQERTREQRADRSLRGDQLARRRVGEAGSVDVELGEDVRGRLGGAQHDLQIEAAVVHANGKRMR